MNAPITLTGLDIINSLRAKLAQSIHEHIMEMEDEESTFYLLSDYLAVATELQIISMKEFEAGKQHLHDFLNMQTNDILEFPPLTKHAFLQTKILEARMLLQIRTQEALNLNMSRCRDPRLIKGDYSESDCIRANLRFLDVAREFDIIDDKQYKYAYDIMQEYVDGHPKTEKIIFIPERFYTRLY